MTIYNPSSGKADIELKMTFMLGLIIIGNVVDNVSQPKWVALFVQIALGSSWILTGTLIRTSENAYKKKDLIHDFKTSFFCNMNLA